MKDVEFVVSLDINIRKRHAHKSEKGRILSFVVQLELFLNNNWEPVIRSDCAHGFAHLDLYAPNKSPKKIPLNLDFQECSKFSRMGYWK